MPLPRVFLADDHEMLLDAFSSLLGDHCEIVGSARDGEELLAKAPASHPDVVVVDIGMPQLNGIDAAADLRRRLPDVHIVFLTVSDDAELAADALAAVPGSSFLLKQAAGSELMRAIDAACKGRSYITASIARALPAQPQHQLTPRQRQVLELLAKGLAMKQVARELGITTRTVGHHKYAMMSALGIDSSAELVRYAVRRGLAR